MNKLATFPLTTGSEPATPRRQRGFTLVEVMVVVAITGILLAVGVPQFQQFIARRNVEAQVSGLMSAFRLARAEAVKRGRLVSLCRSANAEAAAPTCGGGDPQNLGWAGGWIVFEDDIAPVGTVNPGETIILAQGAFNGSGGITNNNGGNNYVVTYRPTGLPVPGSAGATFTVNPKDIEERQGPLVRRIVVSWQGRQRVEKGP